MKLPDFTRHAGFNELRRKMGADLIELVREDLQWKQLCIQLENEGIDVSVKDVQIQLDGTFEYKGQKVVVYIRDQHVFHLNRGSGYKFHLAQCSTLTQMQREGRYGRYVVTNRKDGKFIVNLIRKDSHEPPERIERALSVCKNCLSMLDLHVRPEEFSLKKFFQTKTSRITALPRHNEVSAPINTYRDNWRAVAREVKEHAHWQCEECRTSFAEYRELLHVHHVDGDKTNNRYENLRPLCTACHADQPGHEHMKATPGYRLALRLRNGSSRILHAPKSSMSGSGVPWEVRSVIIDIPPDDELVPSKICEK